MLLSRIAGMFVVAGGALVGVAFGAYLGGAGVGFGETNTQGLIVNAALGAFALGLAALAVAPTSPFSGRVARIGLALLAVGPAAELAYSIIVSASTDGWAPGSPAFLLEVGGARAAFLGALLLGVALARTGGWSGAVGALLAIAALLNALLLNALLMIFSYNRVSLPPHTALAALGLAVLAVVGVGVLAIVREPAVKTGEASRAS